MVAWSLTAPVFSYVQFLLSKEKRQLKGENYEFGLGKNKGLFGYVGFMYRSTF
jgi:hypothetical protein